MVENSAEAELYALTAIYKIGRRFLFLVQEEVLADDIFVNLRHDNQATIAMLENLSWWTKCLSIYGETIRKNKKISRSHVCEYRRSIDWCIDKAYFGSCQQQTPPMVGFDS